MQIKVLLISQILLELQINLNSNKNILHEIRKF